MDVENKILNKILKCVKRELSSKTSALGIIAKLGPGFRQTPSLLLQYREKPESQQMSGGRRL